MGCRRARCAGGAIAEAPVGGLRGGLEGWDFAGCTGELAGGFAGPCLGGGAHGPALLSPPPPRIALPRRLRAAACGLQGQGRTNSFNPFNPRLRVIPPLMQVKQLMAHQLAAEEELALLKKKTSGKHTLEAKVHSKMRWVQGVPCGRPGTGAQLRKGMMWWRVGAEEQGRAKVELGWAKIGGRDEYGSGWASHKWSRAPYAGVVARLWQYSRSSIGHRLARGASNGTRDFDTHLPSVRVLLVRVLLLHSLQFQEMLGVMGCQCSTRGTP